jgi:hypothetical protein
MKLGKNLGDAPPNGRNDPQVFSKYAYQSCVVVPFPYTSPLYFLSPVHFPKNEYTGNTVAKKAMLPISRYFNTFFWCHPFFPNEHSVRSYERQSPEEYFLQIYVR